MQILQQVTNDPFQQQTIVLSDGSQVTIQMYFVPMQYAWIFTSIAYKTFLLQGLRITNNPNMLHQWQNEIPFGLACISPSQREPSQQNDFSSGASNLYLLSAPEVLQYQEFLNSGTI